jgi:hypothetical protein
MVTERILPCCAISCFTDYSMAEDSAYKASQAYVYSIAPAYPLVVVTEHSLGCGICDEHIASSGDRCLHAPCTAEQMEEKEDMASRVIWVIVTKGFTEAENLEQDETLKGAGQRMVVGYTSSVLLITTSAGISPLTNCLSYWLRRG